jgi:hypothetical protein
VNRTGYYLAPVIGEIINEVWFADRDDEGIVYEAYFNPIDNITIALVATVVSLTLQLLFLLITTLLSAD